MADNHEEVPALAHSYPPEVLIEIFGHLVPVDPMDQGYLSACTLVCKTWTRPAQYVMQRTVRISRPTYKSKLQAFNNHSTIRRPQKLQIAGDTLDNTSSTWLRSKAVLKFGKLYGAHIRSVNIDGVQFQSMKRFSAFVALFPMLENLCLCCGFGPDPSGSYHYDPFSISGCPPPPVTLRTLIVHEQFELNKGGINALNEWIKLSASDSEVPSVKVQAFIGHPYRSQPILEGFNSSLSTMSMPYAGDRLRFDNRNYEILSFDFSSNVRLENSEIDATRRRYSAFLVSTLRTITSPNMAGLRLHLSLENYDCSVERRDELRKIVTEISTISSLRRVKIDPYYPIEYIMRIYVIGGTQGLLGSPFIEKIKDLQSRGVITMVSFPEHHISLQTFDDDIRACASRAYAYLVERSSDFVVGLCLGHYPLTPLPLFYT